MLSSLTDAHSHGGHKSGKRNGKCIGVGRTFSTIIENAIIELGIRCFVVIYHLLKSLKEFDFSLSVQYCKLREAEW